MILMTLKKGDCPLFSKHCAGICLGRLSKFAIRYTRRYIQQVFRPTSEAGIPAINIFITSVRATSSENQCVTVIFPEFCLHFIRLFSSLFFFLLIYFSLFSVAVSVWDYKASNFRIVDWRWIGKTVRERGCALFYAVILTFAWRIWTNSWRWIRTSGSLPRF